MALSCTQAERDALAEAIKAGASRVQYQDRTIQYASMAEMRAILSEMDEFLAGTAAKARSSRASFSRA